MINPSLTCLTKPYKWRNGLIRLMDILKNVLEPDLFEKIPIRHIFQHDKDPNHTSKLVKD